MEDLIGLALDTFAKRAQPSGQSPAEQATAERYQRILADLRARATGQEPPSVVPQPAPQRAPVPSQPVAAPQVPPPTAQVPSHAYRHPLQGLFEGGNSLVRAVVAAELLDRPLAMRESAFWQKR